MTVRELLSRISSRELAEWMAFYKLDMDDQRQAALEAKAAGALDSRTR